MKRKFLIFIVVIVLTIAMTANMVYAESTTLTADDFKHKTGTWSGLQSENQGTGDSFLLTDIEITSGPFVFEADVKMNTGGKAAGIVFGVKDTANPGNDWHCLNIDRAETGNNSRIFHVQGNATNLIDYPLTGDQADEALAVTYHLKLQIAADNQVSAYLDNTLIGTYKPEAFPAGYIGVLTWESSALFENVKYSTDAIGGDDPTDTPTATVVPTATNGPTPTEGTDTPKTSDNSSMALWVLLGASLVAFGGLTIIGSKKRAR